MSLSNSPEPTAAFRVGMSSSSPGEKEGEDATDEATGRPRGQTDVTRYLSLFPVHDGSREKWNDFEDKMDNTLPLFEDEPDHIRMKLGALLRNQLTGEAWELVRKMPKSEYRCPDGVTNVIERLRKDCQDKELVRTKAAMKKFTKRTYRRLHESIPDFLTRLELAKVEV